MIPLETWVKTRFISGNVSSLILVNILDVPADRTYTQRVLEVDFERQLVGGMFL
jgi:hypothetical protein